MNCGHHRFSRSGTPLPDHLKGVYLSNVTTGSTKIRVDVLKALAAKLCVENTSQSVVVGAFSSSPFLTVFPPRPAGVPAGSSQPDRRDFLPSSTFTYVDALETFRNRLTDIDLEWAYRRAGRGYRGLLTQTFLVLTEAGREATFARLKASGRDPTPGQGTASGSLIPPRPRYGKSKGQPSSGGNSQALGRKRPAETVAGPMDKFVKPN
jgi:hypothetical protein